MVGIISKRGKGYSVRVMAAVSVTLECQWFGDRISNGVRHLYLLLRLMR